MDLKKLLLSVLMFSLMASMAQAQSLLSVNSVKALRFDPSYIYDLPEFDGLSSPEIASRVAQEISAAGFNTVYLFVYSPVYGALYNTNYPMTLIESGIGREDFTKQFLAAAKNKGLKVIALFPINNYKKVWQTQPTWRIKNRNGNDYRPSSDVYPLTAFSSNYQSWLRGLLKDFLALHPKIDGLEAFEAMVDYNWNDAADYNPNANSAYFAKFPKGRLGDKFWKVFQAEGLTNLQSIVFQEAHLLAKESHVVQTWSARPDGVLMSSREIADGCGFDFDGVLNLPASLRPQFVNIEVMWQQWRSEYGMPIFDPNWVISAGQQLAAKVNNRSIPIVHIELSEFSGSAGTILPTDVQFLSDLQNALSLGYAVDVYDYYQIKARSLFPRVSEVLNR